MQHQIVFWENDVVDYVFLRAKQDLPEDEYNRNFKIWRKNRISMRNRTCLISVQTLVCESDHIENCYHWSTKYVRGERATVLLARVLIKQTSGDANKITSKTTEQKSKSLTNSILAQKGYYLLNRLECTIFATIWYDALFMNAKCTINYKRSYQIGQMQ